MDIKKIMNNQPVINVGMIGHVSNGKSTIVKVKSIWWLLGRYAEK